MTDLEDIFNAGSEVYVPGKKLDNVKIVSLVQFDNFQNIQPIANSEFVYLIKQSNCWVLANKFQYKDWSFQFLDNDNLLIGRIRVAFNGSQMTVSKFSCLQDYPIMLNLIIKKGMPHSYRNFVLPVYQDSIVQEIADSDNLKNTLGIQHFELSLSVGDN